MKKQLILLALISLSCSMIHRIGPNQELEITVQYVSNLRKGKKQRG